MSGIAGVAVKTGVGDEVADGVKLGVNVGPGVGVSTSSTGTPAREVRVAPETMVDMTAVPRKLRSCVGAGTPGTAHACVTINKIATDKRMGVDFRIICLLSVIKAILTPKNADSSACEKDVWTLGFVPVVRFYN
jgi:hypothetical protein